MIIHQYIAELQAELVGQHPAVQPAPGLAAVYHAAPTQGGTHSAQPPSPHQIAIVQSEKLGLYMPLHQTVG